MVAQRESILKAGKALAELVIEGGGTTPTAMRLAEKLQLLCRTGGSYIRQYEDHEERVLMRHLNLYKNKLARAKTDNDRTHWQRKVNEQIGKVTAWRAGRDGKTFEDVSYSGTPDLDLDGL